MSRKVILLLLLSFVFSAGFAQSDTVKVAPGGVIEYRQRNIFSAGHFFVNGNEESVKQIHTRLMNDKISAYDFNKAKKYDKLAQYMAFLLLAGSIATPIVNHGSDTFTNTAAKVTAGATCGFIIPGFVFRIKSDHHFTKAVRLYNQQYQ